jgi:uncharacterized membrane protein YsdA (DUF1294 family)
MVASPLTAVELWVLAWSTVAFLAATLDKARAVRQQERVRERTLLGLAAVGGSPGLLLAMLLARHKTRKGRFLLPVAAIVAVQVAVAWVWLR